MPATKRPERRSPLGPSPMLRQSASLHLEPLEPRMLMTAAVLLTGINAGAVVKGDAPLSVTLTDLPQATGVEYVLNGHLITPAVAAPFSYTFQSAGVWDSADILQAYAVDANNNVLAVSNAIPFSIDNTSGSLQLISPGAGSTLAGTVNWEVLSSGPIPSDGRSPIEATLFYVDGQQVGTDFLDKDAHFSLNTTKFSNGTHELLAASFGHASGNPALGMSEIQVTFNNGHAVQDIRPTYSSLFLRPGQTSPLSPYALYTDGAKIPLAAPVTFASANPAVAAVNAAGIVTATGIGSTTLTTSSLGFSNTTTITVSATGAFSQFSTSGQILSQYDPNNSTFVATMFNLGTDQLASTPGLAAAVKAAGFNAVTNGFYRNPADTGAKSLAAFETDFDAHWNAAVATANATGMHIVLIGDDILRTVAELNNSTTNPWAPQAIQYALTKVRDSGLAISLEMVDEADNILGATPSPAVTQVMTALNSVAGRTPITWPIGALSSNANVAAWMGNPTFANYATDYWDVKDFKLAYPWGGSLPQVASNMQTNTVGREPALQDGEPFMVEISATGAFYVNHGAGSAQFQLGQDSLINPAAPSVDVSAQIMNALAFGAAGVRVYGYDGLWATERLTAKDGDTEQTGTSPFGVGADRWAALSAALNVTQALAPYLLQPQINALDVAPGFVTGARAGNNARLFISVNDTESAASPAVDLTLYAYAGGSIFRYHVLNGETWIDNVPAGSTTDHITYQPGEAVIYLFQPPNNLAPFVPTLTAPLEQASPPPVATPAPVDTPAPAPVPTPAPVVTPTPAPVGDPAPTTPLKKDKTKPKVKFIAPSNKAKVNGVATLNLFGTDNVGVNRIVLTIGKTTIATLTSADLNSIGLYSFNWDTSGLKVGKSFTIKAKVYDATGNNTSASRSFKIVAAV